jgi:hypothetical protein
MSARWILAGALCALGSHALAQEPERLEIGEVVQGHAYYNRPGASPAEHNTELAACLSETDWGTPSPADRGLQRAVEIGTGSLLRSDVVGLFWSGPVQGLAAIGPENCMISKGWRVFRLSETEGEAATALTGEAFLARVGPWLGADTPPGVMIRTWGNEAAHPARYRTASRPRPPSRDQLSLQFFSASGAVFERAGVDTTNWNRVQARTLRLPEIPEPAAGMAIIVMRGVGTNHGLQFQRVEPSADGARFTFGIGVSRQGRWAAAEVPAGRWRINQTRVVNHCLGSPSFEVAAGEVVYVGTFDMSGDDMGPDLDLAPAISAIRGPAAERLRAAVYRNGSTDTCRVPFVRYPLEIEGAPFDPGYQRGSVAAAGPRTP